jgi:hypothetical protein
METFQGRGPDALPRARTAFAQAVHAHHEASRGYDMVLTPTLATEPWRIGHLSPVLGREELIRVPHRKDPPLVGGDTSDVTRCSRHVHEVFEGISQ